ncbi:MAG: NAD-dependent epimerase/dehydratase family protein [Chitinophagaceae bacterium]|nr:NAD-dependent epimerase/dehydratase family protein [Chitinophagaceae bacterium]
MKVALTGAAGHLGAAILQELNSRNIEVKALIRDNDTRALKDLQAGIVKGNILHAGVLENLMQDCDTVIHSAALISVNGDRNGLVYKTNVEGTRMAIETALQAGVKRFIQISSIHAYQQQPSLEILDEQRKPVTDNGFAYDRSKQMGKEIALAAYEKGMEVLVIHPTSIIGPYDHKPSLMGQVIIDLYRGRLPFIFNGGFDFCDCRDVAHAIVNGLTMGKPGESYLLAGKWYSLKELALFLSAASSKKINPVALSPAIARLGLPIIKTLAWIKKEEPLYTVEALDALFTGNRLISSEKAKTDLNYNIRPFEETILDTFGWFTNNGYLDRN